MSTEPGRSNPGSGPASNWDIERVVADLRTRRAGSHQGPLHAGAVVALPSKRALGRIVNGLIASLFPTHFGEPHLTDESVDYFVGHTLNTTLRSLFEQVRHEQRCDAARRGSVDARPDARAAEIVRDFALRLPGIRALLESDIVAAYRGDPAAKNLDEILLCYPGLTAIAHHRLANALYELGAPLIARLVSRMAHAVTGVDIHPGATIGGSFFIDHGTGVVIGETAVVGERVRLYQAVTLGAKRFAAGEDGALLKGIPRHPIVEDDVVVYAGATILGRVTIGRGSVIGGNVWLTRSVPPGSQVSQAHVRSETFDGGSGI